ncbi:hypothetical protein N665_0078s0018 [Sinapis alba]|nr:hypothetical protein N665_0078s0018 [Sinapis alba]
MSCKNQSCSRFSFLFKLLLLMILYSGFLLPASSSCRRECGGITIPPPFGIGNDCYLEKSYEIKCRNTTSSRKQQAPFLSVNGQEVEVVNISLPAEERYYTFITSYIYRNTRIIKSLSFGLVRVKIPVTSAGCFNDRKESTESIMDLTGSPFFIDDVNSLVAVGCNAKVSLTHIEPNIVGCELTCNTNKDQPSKSIPFLDQTGCSGNSLSYKNVVCTGNKPEETKCYGKGCCQGYKKFDQARLTNEPQQTIGIRIESNDGNLTTTTTREEHCRVAFITDEVYTSSNATKPRQLFGKGYATLTLVWVIQTKNNSFLSSLPCNNIKDTTSSVESQRCICDKTTISNVSYAHCGCKAGYTGNAYIHDGCKDVDECKLIPSPCGEGNTCVNTKGNFHCLGDKKRAILIGASAGFVVLALVGGLWWLRKFVIKRKFTKRKKKFFQRNGGLLLQQKLNTSEGNVENTRIFSSRELEKATENFSENRVLGHGGQGTVYKGMLLDGRTVAVKKSKVIDEDKLQEFINEVVILSQINHRHVVKLLGCCLETEVPILVYEFILNGNLFQHIQEDSDDYTMKWGMRLRIAVDVAGALSYLHSSASSPVYHRDIKSTNILLDEKHRAKVADFGTSRSITIDQTHWTTVVSGTVGYVDPEYYRSSQYTDKSDVYSFGVVLAELITGDKPVVIVQNTQEKISLADHFRLSIKEKRLSDIIDARIKDDYKPKQVAAVANVAWKCLSWKGKKRPNMREVFMELERICTSPEDSQVQQIHFDEEEEVWNMINKGDSWSIGVTAPALSSVASPSSSDVKPLFPRPTL